MTVRNGNGLWTNVLALVNKPPYGDEDGKSTGDQAGIIHRLSIGRERVRKAENDNECEDVDA